MSFDPRLHGSRDEFLEGAPCKFQGACPAMWPACKAEPGSQKFKARGTT